MHCGTKISAHGAGLNFSEGVDHGVGGGEIGVEAGGLFGEVDVQGCIEGGGGGGGGAGGHDVEGLGA